MEQTPPFETVTKIEAAERQLRVAIRMFFERRDMIAVHTIAAAAHEILRQLNAPLGFESIFDYGAKSVIPEKREEFRQLFRRDQNFFKHAGKDPNEKLDFYSEGTKFYLFDATRLLVSLTGRHVPETAALTAYFIAKYPNMFNLDDMPELQRIKEFAKKLNADDFEMILFGIDHLTE